VEFLGVQCGAEFDDAVDLAGSGVALRVGHASRDDDGFAGSGYVFLAVEGEVGFAGQDGEALFLAGVDVLGDDAAGHAAPAEADELAVVVGGDGGVPGW
jgi:hypothetical protein